MLRDEKGQLKNLPNHYGRFKDKELIIGYAVNRENFELGEDAVDKRANESRSLMQKYYCMVKYGTEYSEKETKRIHRYVHYRNQQNKKQYQQAIEKGYSGEEFLEKIVPEDIFQKYGYLFENSSNGENIKGASNLTLLYNRRSSQNGEKQKTHWLLRDIVIFISNPYQKVRLRHNWQSQLKESVVSRYLYLINVHDQLLYIQ